MALAKDQRDDVVTVRIELGDIPEGALEIAELRGVEAISRLFELEVLVISRDGRVDSGSIIGERATLVFERGGEEIRRVHGMVSTANDRLDTETGHTSYRLTIVPRAYRMTLHETLDIFMDLSVPEILEKLFAISGLKRDEDYELRLYEHYPKREFVVQYRETDLAFASRWMEHHGISFFFEHREDREVIVVTDQNVGFSPIPGGETIPFRAHGDRRDVFRLETSATLVPSRVMIRDYNYRTPLVPLEATADIPQGYGGEVVEYGAHFKTPDEGAKLVKVRIEEKMAGRRTFTGEADTPRVTAGAWLKLEDHPWGDMELLLTEVTHHVKQSALGMSDASRFATTFKAIPRNVAFRPARATPRPRVHGVLTGIICAENDESRYAELDDEGRYRVKFLYDTRDANGVQASRPVRMMQPHSGAGYGMHFPLRPGVEVLITCVDGDPDRPIIAGTVPNPQTSSPVVAKNAPRNILRTGGNNEINIDDSEDGERIKMTTPRRGTSFQLGAPNDPIDGISAKTEGHISNASIEGTSQWTTFSMNLSAFVDLVRSGTILNIASSPNLLTLAAAASAIFQGVVSGGFPFAKDLYDHSKSRIEEQRQNMFRAEAESLQAAIAASQAAKAAKQACDLCKLQAKSKLPNRNNLTAEQQAEYDALVAKIDAFDAAQASCDNSYLTAIGTLEDRNGIVDANRTNFLNDNFSPVMYRDANDAVSTYDYAKFVALKTAEDEARWDTMMADLLAKANEDRKKNNQPELTIEQFTTQKAAEGLTRDAWLAEEQKKWNATPPDQTLYQAALSGDFDSMTDAQKSALPDDIWTAAGVTKGNFANLTAEQKDKVKAAWLAAQPAAADEKAIRDKCRQEVQEQLTAMLAGQNVTQEPYKSYKAYQDALSSCGAKCTTDLDNARNQAIDTNNAYAALMEANTPQIYALQKLSNANEQAIANQMAAGINMLLAIFAFLELFTARTSLVDRWRSARKVLDREKLPHGEVEHVYNEVKRWAIPITGSIPILAAIPGMPGVRPHRTHVIGSDDSTEVFGKRDLVVWSETAMILGMGTKNSIASVKARAAALKAKAHKFQAAAAEVDRAKRVRRRLALSGAILSDTAALVGNAMAVAQIGVSGLPLAPDTPDRTTGKVVILAPEVVRVLSPGGVYIQGNDLVDVLSRDTLQLAVKKNAQDDKERAFVKLEKGKLSAEVDDDNGDLAAQLDLGLNPNKDKGQALLRTNEGPNPGPELNLNANDKKAKLDTRGGESLTLDSVAHTAELLATTWKLKLEEGNDKGVLLGLDGGWRLTIKENEIGLGNGAVGLLVTDQNAILRSADKMTLTAANKITLTSTLVDFGASAIKSQYLDIKGVNDPTLPQLRARANAAMKKAKAAMKKATTATRTANRAEQTAQLAAIRAQLALLLALDDTEV